MVPTIGYSQNNPDEIVSQFFATYETSPENAVDNLFVSNKWMSENQSGLMNLKTQLNNTIALIGDYKGFEKVAELKKGDSLIQLIYHAKYDRQPLRVIFLFYKPDQQWRIQNFLFDDKILED